MIKPGDLTNRMVMPAEDVDLPSLIRGDCRRARMPKEFEDLLIADCPTLQEARARIFKKLQERVMGRFDGALKKMADVPD